METELINQKENLPEPNPRLTMKFLHTLIKEIQLEDRLLLQRVEEIEQRMIQIYHNQEEVAVTDEPLRNQSVSLVEEIQDQEIKITRAVRHALPRTKSIWFRR